MVRIRPAAAATHALLLLSLSLPLSSSLDVPREGGTKYDEQFFEQHRKNAQVYPALVKAIGSSIAGSNPLSSVVDVGCGHGLLVEAFRSSGIKKSYGVEGSESARKMWPAEFVTGGYYRVQDLTREEEAREAMPLTDLVTTFEVAEHLPPESASGFVRLLSTHRPRHIVFGAATVWQDRGKNPTHVNENTFRYWIDKFSEVGYVPDLVATASVRHKLITDQQFQQKMSAAWWYPKNAFVFVDSDDSSVNQSELLDRKLLSHPEDANMRSEVYLNLGGSGEFGQLWKRDWLEFATIFYEEQEKARIRLGAKTRKGSEL